MDITKLVEEIEHLSRIITDTHAFTEETKDMNEEQRERAYFMAKLQGSKAHLVQYEKKNDK